MSALPPPPPDPPPAHSGLPTALPGLPTPPPPMRVAGDERPPTATWRWWEILLVALGGFVVSAFPVLAIYRAFDRDPTTETALLDGVSSLANAVAQVVVLLVLVGYLTLRHRGWQLAVRFPRLRAIPREVAIGLACGVGAVFALDALLEYVLQPIFRVIADREIAPAVQIGSDIQGWGAVAFFVAAAIVAPLVEELFFRGLFFRSLRDRYGFWIGALGSGLLFAISHSGDGDLAEILMLQIAIGLFGIGLAAIYEWRGTLGANVAAHVVFNLITVLSTLAVS